MRTFVVLLLLLALGAGGAWYYAGRTPPPTIEIVQPGRAVGQTGELLVEVGAPSERLQTLNVWLEQGEQRTALYSLASPPAGVQVEQTQEGMRIKRPLGKREFPELQAGSARIVVEATRPVLFELRSISASTTHDFEVRLIPPQLSVQSMHHYINHGGSEMVVYRVSPGAISGVRVGDLEYPGFPASGAGIAGATPDLHAAFFALLWNQDPSTPISLFARDDVGNESRATFDYRVFPKQFRRSRIEINDRFLARVVPAILANTPDFQVQDPADLLGSFLSINRDMRQQNNAAIAALAASTSPKILWQGPFKQLVNSAVEAGFADQRTYIYKGDEIDRQVHLGFDLASLSNAPVLAANSGKVVFAGWLGIYGNCVILDHGMGLQSLYAHLSSIGVAVGSDVASGQELGRSGATGMAGGDHLHFTMLLNGQAVTPIDWWSPQWVRDRIQRKFAEAGTNTSP